MDKRAAAELNLLLLPVRREKMLRCNKITSVMYGDIGNCFRIANALTIWLVGRPGAAASDEASAAG
jgi:hypothetical protein